jgi:Fe-S-cluster containining protein
MTNLYDNPCHECSVNCCSKMGLFLSKEEYFKLFQPYEDRLRVKKKGAIYIVLPQIGGVCPYLSKGVCRIYAQRPIDCQIYPYVLRHFIKKGNKAKITYHTGSDCPQKYKLYQLMSEREVRSLISKLGKQLYGENILISVHCEGGGVSQLLNRIEATLFRRLNRIREIFNPRSERY